MPKKLRAKSVAMCTLRSLELCADDRRAILLKMWMILGVVG